MTTLTAPKIGFLLFDGFPMACLTSMIEPMRAANEISQTQSFQWVLIGEGAGRVTASADVAFETSQALTTELDVDYLILLSAPTIAFQNPRTAAILRSLSRHGVTLGAVSGGVFPLVRSGVALRGAVSVHWCYEAAFRAEFPHVAASDQVIETGTGFVTASGAAAAFDLALQLIRAQLSDAVATEVACWFQHPMMRGSDIRQSIPEIGTGITSEQALPPKVARAIDLYSKSLFAPPSISEIAAALNITTRHLERSFKQATGQSPSHYFRMMRMKAARQLVMYTNDSLADIAAAVGYSAAATLRRHYSDAFGVAPLADRKRINLFRVEGNIPVPSV